MPRDRVRRGIIRKGQKKPFYKCTNQEMEARLDEVELFLRQGPLTNSQLLKLVRNRFNLSFQMGLIYISRARQRLLKRIAEPKENHRAKSLAFYESVIASDDATYKEKVKAQNSIDKLLGLDIPVPRNDKIELNHSGAVVSPSVALKDLNIPLETKKRILEDIRNLRRKREQEDVYVGRRSPDSLNGAVWEDAD